MLVAKDSLGSFDTKSKTSHKGWFSTTAIFYSLELPLLYNHDIRHTLTHKIFSYNLHLNVNGF
jgi:muramoyltetrapeptide carboxypeptidase LdcA involved in peptidoglycan recycling